MQCIVPGNCAGWRCCAGLLHRLSDMARKRTTDIAPEADDNQPPKRKIGELRRLGRFLNPYRIYVVGALLALTVAAGTVLTIGQGVRRLVGQEDASYDEARRLLGSRAIVGVTCHDSRHLAMAAAEAGADYVAFGAFFPTSTKTPKFSARPDLLNWWSDIMEAPCVAIGGITVENCAPLVSAGADFLAVSAGVWSHPQGPGAAVTAFNEIFDNADHGTG